MDGIDGELERRVWLRVRGGMEEPAVSRQQLAVQELACGRELRRLAGFFSGRSRGILLELAEMEFRHGKRLARYLGTVLPEHGRAGKGNMTGAEALEQILRHMEDRTKIYGERSVAEPENELLRRLAWEERQGCQTLRVLLCRHQNGKRR